MKNFFTALTLTALVGFSVYPASIPPRSKALSISRDASEQIKAARAISPDELHALTIVDELPDGLSDDLYSRDSFFFARDGQGYLYNMADYGLVADIALSDTEAYIKNPFAGFTTHSYIKGERKGDKASFSFPQLVYVESYPDFENDPEGTLGLMVTDRYYAYVLELRQDTETSGMYIADNQTVEFSINENGISQEGNYFIGLIGEVTMRDENGDPYQAISWMGYSDGALHYNHIDAQPLETPSSAQFEKWILEVDGNQSFVELAFDNEDVYLRGFQQCENRADGSLEFPAIKGNLKEGKVTFPEIQYLGVDSFYDHFAWFIPTTYTGMEDMPGEYIYTRSSGLSFDYNPEARTMTANPGEALVVSTISDGIFTILALNDPSLAWQDMKTPLTPCEPTDLYFEFYDDFQYGVFSFSLSNLATDGRLMENAALFYNIYIDEEEFTFYPDEYWSLEEPMTDVPYDYWDMDIVSYGELHDLVIYIVGCESIGVRAMYRNVDGTTSYSDIVTLNTAAVRNISSEESPTIRTEWYDLAGRRIAAPADGISIRRDFKADGSVVSSKEIGKRR